MAQEVGIDVTATDRTRAGLASAGKAIDGLKAKVKGASGAIGALPEMVSKASAALVLVQNSTSQLGGKLADAANKIVGVIGLIAVGGPLGAGLAAVTGLVAGLSAAWEAFTFAAKQAASEALSLEFALKKLGDPLDRQIAKIEDLEKAVANYGKTASEVRIAELKAAVESARVNIPIFEQQLTLLDRQLKTDVARGRRTKENAEETFRLNQKALQMAKAQFAANQRQLAGLSALEEKETEENDTKERSNKLAQRRAERVREANQQIAAAVRLAEQVASKDEAAAGALEGLIKAGKKAQASRRLTITQRRELAGVIKANSEAIREEIKLQEELAVKQEETANRAAASARARTERVIALDQKSAEHFARLEDEKAKAAEDSAARTREVQVAALNTIADAFVDTFEQVIRGNKTMEEALTDTLIGLGKMAIKAAIQFAIGELIKTAAAKASANVRTAAAVQSGAGEAISAHAGIPIVGIAIGLAAAAAIVAAILAFKKFAHGGLVTGGTAGRDSVPALLTPGELVVPAGMTRQLLNLGGRAGSGGMQAGGVVTDQAGAVRMTQGANVNITLDSTIPPRDVETKKAVRSIGREFKELERRGTFGPAKR